MRVSLPQVPAVAALGAALVLAAAAPLHAELQSQPAPPGLHENAKANESLRDPPQTGRMEPSATHAATADQTRDGAREQPDRPALVNGALNVAGAPKDSQTVPAKYSERNDRLDHIPIMALPMLTDEQQRQVRASVLAAHAPVQEVNAKPADALAYGVQMRELPPTNDPVLRNLKFVQTLNTILLVKPSSRVVVAQIRK